MIIRPDMRRKALSRLLLIAIIGALVFSWLLYHSANAADYTAKILVLGQPASGLEYTLDGDPVSTPAGRALLHGYADPEGMIHATGIATGTWTLSAGCLVGLVYVGEVAGQVTPQEDATCRAYVPGVFR